MPPPRGRGPGFALEVDQQPGLRRAQYLSEMQVAVHALDTDRLPFQRGIALRDGRYVPGEWGNTRHRRREALTHPIDRHGGSGGPECGGQVGVN